MASQQQQKCSSPPQPQVEQVVVFEDVPRQYSPQQDLFVVYRFTKGYRPSSRDWVGLFRAGWSHTRQFLAFDWAPKQPRDIKFPELRAVLFKADYLGLTESETQYYQYLYVTKYDEVVGTSRKFRLLGYQPPLQCVVRPLDGIGELTFVESQPETHPGVADSFEIVRATSAEDTTAADAASASDDHTSTTNDSSPESQRNQSEAIFLNQVSQFRESGKDIMEIIDALDKASSEDSIVKVYEDEHREVALVHVRSRDRALVKVQSRDKALVPYSPSKTVPIFSLKKKSPTSVANEKPASQSPPITPSNFVFTFGKPDDMPVVTVDNKRSVKRNRKMSFCGSRDCRQHWKNARETKKLRQKLESTLTDLHKVKGELQKAQEALDIKTVVCEELGEKVKDLVHENSALTGANNDMYRQARQLRPVTAERGVLRRDKQQLTARVRELEAAQQKLQLQVELLQEVNRRQGKYYTQVYTEKINMKEELEALEKENAKVETQLDDIMFTLSLQGTTHLTGADGKAVALPEPSAQAQKVDLDGWQLALTRRNRQALASLAAKDRSIQQLEQQAQQLRREAQTESDQVTTLTAKVKEESESSEGLRRELITADGRVHHLSQQVAALREEVTANRDIKTQLQTEHEEREKQLRKRVKMLSTALQVAKHVPMISYDESVQTDLPSTASTITQTSVKTADACVTASTDSPGLDSSNSKTSSSASSTTTGSSAAAASGKARSSNKIRLLSRKPMPPRSFSPPMAGNLQTGQERPASHHQPIDLSIHSLAVSNTSSGSSGSGKVTSCSGTSRTKQEILTWAQQVNEQESASYMLSDPAIVSAELSPQSLSVSSTTPDTNTTNTATGGAGPGVVRKSTLFSKKSSAGPRKFLFQRFTRPGHAQPVADGKKDSLTYEDEVTSSSGSGNSGRGGSRNKGTEERGVSRRGSSRRGEVEVINNVCSRCGITFPAGTSWHCISKHKAMHAARKHM